MIWYAQIIKYSSEPHIMDVVFPDDQMLPFPEGEYVTDSGITRRYFHESMSPPIPDDAGIGYLMMCPGSAGALNVTDFAVVRDVGGRLVDPASYSITMLTPVAAHA